MSLLLAKQIGILFIYIFAGFLLVRSGLLRSEQSAPLSILSLYLITPCLILNAFQIEFSSEIVTGVLLSLLYAVLAHLLFLLLTAILRKPLKLDAVEQASLIYTNCGNLILPLITALLGSEWLIYSTVFICVHLILLWSHGRSLLSGARAFSLRALLTNVNILSCAAGLILFVFRLRLPAFLLTVTDSLASMVGPINMIVIGMLIGGAPLYQIFTNRRVYLVSALRLLLLPVVLLLVLKCSGLPNLHPNGSTLLLITLLAASAPSASAITQMSQVFGSDAVQSSQISILSTIFSILTMPLVVQLYTML